MDEPQNTRIVKLVYFFVSKIESLGVVQYFDKEVWCYSTPVVPKVCSAEKLTKHLPITGFLEHLRSDLENIIDLLSMDRWLKSGSLKKTIKTSATVPPVAMEASTANSVEEDGAVANARIARQDEGFLDESATAGVKETSELLKELPTPTGLFTDPNFGTSALAYTLRPNPVEYAMSTMENLLLAVPYQPSNHDFSNSSVVVNVERCAASSAMDIPKNVEVQSSKDCNQTNLPMRKYSRTSGTSRDHHLTTSHGATREMPRSPRHTSTVYQLRLFTRGENNVRGPGCLLMRLHTQRPRNGAVLDDLISIRRRPQCKEWPGSLDPIYNNSFNASSSPTLHLPNWNSKEKQKTFATAIQI
uniref:Uncharacterized protein n=1 Tax=Timema douglasi TaxID=61478 RepID=A0A7R8VAU3_TIMDO|nr:unnamed protein product [Timema douglasi]